MPTNANPDRKAKQAATEERRKRVAANLLAGLNYRDMAEALGVSLSTIHKDVQVVLARWREEQVQDAGEWIATELRRLDRATNAIWGEVSDGNLAAIDRLLKIQDRRSKYLGLDAPEKKELSGPDGDTLQIEHLHQHAVQAAELAYLAALGIEPTLVRPEGDDHPPDEGAAGL